METITEHKLVSVTDPETGNIVQQDEFIKISRNVKANGYNLVYLDRLVEGFLVLKSVSNVYIALDILQTKTNRKSFQMSLKYKSLAKEYNTTERQMQMILNLMGKATWIVTISKGVYLANPYLLIPKGMDDRTVAYFQNEWDKRA